MGKTYKYDTHVHTVEGSACAKSTAREMVRAYIRAGYSGIIITDHFFNGNTAVPRDLPWTTMVEMFCRGYENALDEAKGTGFNVFFGWEYADRGTEFLTYGLDKNFLLKHPDLLSWDLEKYFKIIKESGGFISHAHPFREASYIKDIRLFPEYVDAVEVINGGHVGTDFDKKAFNYATKHGLLQTAGTDSHRVDKIHGYGMEFEHEIETIEDFIQGIKKQRYTLNKADEDIRLLTD